MSDVDEIKSRINIVDIIGKRVALKKTGRNFKGLCPFHNEKTPAFIVSPERESWHCFGCGIGGDIFSFVMEYEHIDFPEALEELAEIAGVKLPRRVGETPEAKLKQKILEVNHLASEYYHYVLTKHALGAKARDYLKKRGVTDKSIKTFGLGYSPNSWDALSMFLKKKGYDAQLLDRAGLTARGRYDMFRGRVMFTLKDHRGNVVGFSGRVLDPKAKEAKYINTSETPAYVKSNVLYGLDVTRGAIQKENEAVVMEGELDVISSFQEGIGNVVAIKGSALTEGHVNLLKRYAERLIFALDSDLAGDAAARRGIEIADRAGLDMRVVSLPSGKDPDDAARENPVALKQAIKDAVPIYDYFISSALKRFDVASAFGKKKISAELLPVLAKIENPIVQGHYIKKLGHAIDTTEDNVREAMKKEQSRSVYNSPKLQGEEKQDVAQTRHDKLEIYVLALLLQGKTADLFEEFTGNIALEYVANSAVKKILEHLQLFLKKNSAFMIKDFAESLPPELIPTVDEAFLWDIGDFLENEESFAEEWIEGLRSLEREVVKRRLHEITARMHAGGDSSGDDKALKELTDRLKALEKAA